ncbi:MAG: NAD(P)/FAD-dependent oxidoreductase [Spirochaetes bacterium]|mgnify:CR=1 FL=1|nr:NAD(P)/FAD-dependent oxidoreductase [Spirochaetota bacterium]
MQSGTKRVVILGAGFGGLFAAGTLAGKDITVTIIDRNNFHTFYPLLYQVGAAELEPADIAYPVRSVLRTRKNIRFLMAEITGISTAANLVKTDRGDVPYDYLIIATGSRPDFYGIKGAREHTLNLNTLDDAIRLRNHILGCFEKASLCNDPAEAARLLTFAVIGGGPTGVEFSGAFAELVRGPLYKDFPDLDLGLARIILIDAAPGLIPGYSKKASAYTGKILERMGVTVMTGSAVRRVDADAVFLSDGAVIRAATILWTAGVSGEDVRADRKFSSRPDRRIESARTLQLKDAENVFVCGDMAWFEQQGKPLPMMAPVATQQGVHAAKSILRMVQGKKPLEFRFKNRGSMITIGRNSAVARIGSFEVKGFPAWILWLGIHIFFLIGFRNKIFVLIRWFGDYIFFERAGRMIIPSRAESLAGIKQKRSAAGAQGTRRK